VQCCVEGSLGPRTSQSQQGSLPVSPMGKEGPVTLEAIHTGVGWVWDQDYTEGWYKSRSHQGTLILWRWYNVLCM